MATTRRKPADPKKTRATPSSVRRKASVRAARSRPEFEGFEPALRFLRKLKRNNDRAWFEAHRDEYETAFVAPALAFVRALGRELAGIAPSLVADPRRQGGSLFRIHRDVRFSKDKSPYKTWLAMRFPHELGRDVHAPGCYVHVDPQESFLGAGIWHPDGETLRAIRRHLVADEAGWRRLLGDRRRKRGGWEPAGDSLKRAPAGFDPEHPLIEDLRRKDFILVSKLDTEALLRPDLPAKVARRLEQGALDHVAWLCEALDVAFERP